MPPVPTPDEIRFVFDEDSRGFGLWLSPLRKDMTCVGADPVAGLLPLGTPDPEWIPLVAERGWVAVTKNSRIRTQPQEAALAVQHGLLVACVMEPVKNATRWDFARMIMRHRDAVADLSTHSEATWLAIYRDRFRLRPYQPGAPERARDGHL